MLEHYRQAQCVDDSPHHDYSRAVAFVEFAECRHIALDIFDLKRPQPDNNIPLLHACPFAGAVRHHAANRQPLGRGGVVRHHSQRHFILGAAPSFLKNVDPAGLCTLGFSNNQPGKGARGGTLATLLFEAKGPGQATILISGVTGMSASGAPIPFQTGEAKITVR